MFITFLKGIVFGFGVVVAFVIALIISSNIDFPVTVQSQKIEELEPWNSFTAEEKIQNSSALMVLRFNQEYEGLMSAYVSEIHTKGPSVLVNSKVGDLRKKDDYYAREHTTINRDGVVVFLTGNQAKERSQLYLYNNRLAGTTDMPLNIVIKKFNEAK